MGNKLFGIDIAGIVHANVSPGLLKATLIREVSTNHETRANAAPTKTYPEYPCRGIVTTFSMKDRKDNAEILATDAKIMIIGDSLRGGIEPEAEDSVRIEGKTYKVLQIIDRDPAKATFTLWGRV